MPKRQPATKPAELTWFEKWEKTIKGIGAVVVALAATGGAIASFWNQIHDYYKEKPKSSSICQFSNGWIDYSTIPALPLDIICNDGTGNSGHIVEKGTGLQIRTSTVCQFSFGWHDYSPNVPVPLGSACYDGRGNAGKIVSAGQQEGSRF